MARDVLWPCRFTDANGVKHLSVLKGINDRPTIEKHAAMNAKAAGWKDYTLAKEPANNPKAVEALTEEIRKEQERDAGALAANDEPIVFGEPSEGAPPAPMRMSRPDRDE